MTDRPIIFSAPMVRALLAGTKTQTRRLADAGGKPMPGLYETDDRGMLVPIPRPSPWRKAKPGDRLYVREAWHAARSLDTTPPKDIPRDADIEPAATARNYAEIGLKGKLRPSIHMPRWASRLTLIVTDVRVQRLQEITEEDARAEGAEWRAFEAMVTSGLPDGHRCGFADLWNTLHGPDAWAANPWIVALTFTVERRNIDAPPTDLAPLVLHEMEDGK